MSIDQSSEFLETSSPFPFDTRAVLEGILSDLEDMPPGYGEIAKRCLHDPNLTEKRPLANHPKKQLGRYPPFVRYVSKPLLHDHWEHNEESIGRICLPPNEEDQVHTIIRLQDFAPNIGQFWDSSTQLLPRALNFGLTLDCSDPQKPSPEQIFVLGSDAELALGGLEYLDELEEKLKDEGTPTELTDAIFNITTPPNNQTDWFRFEQRLATGSFYLLPPVIKKLMVDQGLYVDQSYCDSTTNQKVDQSGLAPQVTAFVEHTPNGARVTVVDSQHDKFYVFSETVSGVYLLDGRFNDNGDPSEERIKKIPDDVLPQSERIFQQKVVSHIRLVDANDGQLFFVKSKTTLQADCRSGMIIFRQNTNPDELHSAFKDEEYQTDNTQMIPLAGYLIRPNFPPICNRRNTNRPIFPKVIFDPIPPNLTALETAMLVLHHEMCDLMIQETWLTRDQYNLVVRTLKDTVELADRLQIKRTAKEQYDVYRQSVKEILGSRSPH